MTRILLINTNLAAHFSHRRLVGQLVTGRGHEFIVAVPRASDEDHARAEEDGLTWRETDIPPGLANPMVVMNTIKQLVALIRETRPDVINVVGMKSAALLGLAAPFAPIRSVVFNVAGLGDMWIHDDLKTRVVRQLALTSIRRLMKGPRRTFIFENPTDVGIFQELGLARPEQCVQTVGSGVQLHRFDPTPQPEGDEPAVVLPCRINWAKGVGEFVEAARLLKQRGVKGRMCLVGSTAATNPRAISQAQVEAWVAEGVIEWWGHRTDMPEVYRSASVICLPSYREGLSKVLQEAAASARPVVTTDVPGCRDAVVAGETAFVVPPKDATSLADALQRLLESRELREKMGQAGRELAEAQFDVQHIASFQVDAMERLAAS